MSDKPEYFISRPLSIQRSDLARIKAMAENKRVNFSSLVRMLVMPQVEAWECEQETKNLERAESGN
jgi:hypothetical protein